MLQNVKISNIFNFEVIILINKINKLCNLQSRY